MPTRTRTNGPIPRAWRKCGRKQGVAWEGLLPRGLPGVLSHRNTFTLPHAFLFLLLMPVSKGPILIIGSNGRLGAALVREWRAAGEIVHAFGRAEFDLAWDVPKMRAALKGIQFSALVNCAAQTNVDRCETNEEEAFQLNAQAPTVLADICRDHEARIIHISTDYVFDGARTIPYTEDDPAQPISIYGASKRAGEAGVLTASEGQGLVVRVSWVFGPDRPSFVDQILDRAGKEDTVSAVADKIATPTYTLDVARLLRPLLFDVPAVGLLHLCNGGECTWQQYGQHALDCAAAAGIPLKAHTVAPQRMADLKAFIARRPPYTAMSTTRLTELTGAKPRDWREAVDEYVRTKVK
jgi:dTDP-4-dehydrorhamnose reductase